MLDTLRRDIRAVFKRDPAARSLPEVLFCYPALRATCFRRQPRWCWTHRLKLIGCWLSWVSWFPTRVETPPLTPSMSSSGGKEVGWMWRAKGRVTVGLALSQIIMLPIVGLAAQPSPETVIPHVETAFQRTMDFLSYRDYSRLWEASTPRSRSNFTEDGFAAQMEKGMAQLAAGRPIEDIKVSLTSPQTALVSVRIGLEHKQCKAWGTQSFARSFLFFYEEGSWRPQLSDFLALAHTNIDHPSRPDVNRPPGQCY
jgi:hypothetical protein